MKEDLKDKPLEVEDHLILLDLKVGQRIYFKKIGYKKRPPYYRVMAISHRYLLATRGFNKNFSSDRELMKFQVSKGTYKSMKESWRCQKHDLSYVIIDLQSSFMTEEKPDSLDHYSYRSIQDCRNKLRHLEERPENRAKEGFENEIKIDWNKTNKFRLSDWFINKVENRWY